MELAGEAGDASIGALAAADRAGEPGGGPRGGSADAGETAAGVTPDDFRETLYFLDDAEMRRLAEEVRREAERDLWADVISALFDRLEDGSEERQKRILAVLGELLAYAAAARRSFERAAGLPPRAGGAGAATGTLRPRRCCARSATSSSSWRRGETVQQLALTLEENPDSLRDGAPPGAARLLPARVARRP